MILVTVTNDCPLFEKVDVTENHFEDHNDETTSLHNAVVSVVMSSVGCTQQAADPSRRH